MIRRIKLVVVAATLACTGLAACSSGEGNTRTIEVDYQTDEFAGVFLGYFPRSITVTPGSTVKFHQTWNGEPHTITMGKMIDEGYAPLRSLLGKYLSGEEPIPDEPPKEYDAKLWEETLPSFFGEAGVNQAAALPCYVQDKGDLPKDPTDPCAKKFRDNQPEFDGKYAYYSSGFIPFEGDLANEFELKLSDDIEDGTYGYYCNLHGVLMSGEITVKRGAEITAQGDLNRQGRDEAKHAIDEITKILDEERAGKGEFPLPLAGSAEAPVNAAANEFTPRTIETKVGEKVTWTFIGNHTISFNVPPYSPLFQYDQKGFLQYNEKLDKAAGGWPGAPEGGDEDEGPPRDPVSVDAGEWDGSGGLHSSGTGWSDGDKYSVTFTKAGTYPYACLIHPGQIGKVVVK